MIGKLRKIKTNSVEKGNEFRCEVLFFQMGITHVTMRVTPVIAARLKAVLETKLIGLVTSGIGGLLVTSLCLC